MLFILVLTNVSLVRFHFVCPDDFSLDGNSDVPVPEETACRPTILSQLTKATVIKRADEFMVSDDNGQRPDLVIFSCQDSYIYILGLVRYPFIHLLHELHIFVWALAVLICLRTLKMSAVILNLVCLDYYECDSFSLQELSYRPGAKHGNIVIGAM